MHLYREIVFQCWNKQQSQLSGNVDWDFESLRYCSVTAVQSAITVLICRQSLSQNKLRQRHNIRNVLCVFSTRRLRYFLHCTSLDISAEMQNNLSLANTFKPRRKLIFTDSDQYHQAPLCRFCNSGTVYKCDDLLTYFRISKKTPQTAGESLWLQSICLDRLS